MGSPMKIDEDDLLKLVHRLESKLHIRVPEDHYKGEIIPDSINMHRDLTAEKLADIFFKEYTVTSDK